MACISFVNAQFIPLRHQHQIAVSKNKLQVSAIPARRVLRSLPSAKAKDSSDLEDRLLSSISTLREGLPDASLHKYRAKRPEEFADAVAAATELERSGQGFGATVKRLSNLLQGTWRLILTDSKAVEKNAGSITGLGNLPGARCTNVEVRLERDGKASTVERVKVFGGLLDGENALEGKWRVDGSTLEVTYAKAILMGKATVRADSKAVLRTTFCSRRTRIGRSASGELYVFQKQ